jgi:signal peptidase I
MVERSPEEKNSAEGSKHEVNNGEPRRAGGESFWIDLISFSLISALIVIPIRLFVASPFIVNGSSMYPTFAAGDYLIVDQITYKLEEPERGDVIVFRYPNDPSKFFIKRVIGLPNETIIIGGDSIRIVNEKNPDGFELNEPYLANAKHGDGVFNLGDDEYVVLGDNRSASADSRSWGALSGELVVGRAILRVFPLTAFEVFPGRTNTQ